MEVTTAINIFLEHYQVLLFLILITIFVYFKKHQNLPPGPWSLPIVGYWPFLREQPHIGLSKLGEKYGNVMSLYLGNVLVIMLSDHKAIKEAFVKQGYVFSGKPKVNVFKDIIEGGLPLADAEVARPHRRFILSSFRDFGMGKTSLELQIIEEVKYFLEEIRKENGKPFNIEPSLTASVANIIAILEFGKRFTYDDEEFNRVKDILNYGAKFLGSVTMRTFLKWTRYIPFTENYMGFQFIKTTKGEIRRFFIERLQQYEKNHIEGSRSNYIDGFLTERNSIMKKTGSEGYFNENEFLGNLSRLFAAGTLTTSGHLHWSVVYLLKYPDIKKKLMQEIDEVIGQNRDPTYTDIRNMPYTEAFILEIHRHCTILPFTLVHSNTEETELFGFTIPKRSYVLANLWAVHHDKNLWKNSDKFMPERFINQEGKVEKPEYLIPFSIGKRNCIGESLANVEIFLHLTMLLQQFDLKIPKGETISLETYYGISLTPKPFKILAVAK